MRILTLFLALFLTLLPEGVPFIDVTQGHDVCVEEVCEVEDEATIRTPQRVQRRILTLSKVLFKGVNPHPIKVAFCHPVIFYFERQWLVACKLIL